MKLDLSKFQERPSLEKAVMHAPMKGIVFGTVYVASRAEAEGAWTPPKTVLERHWPDVHEFMYQVSQEHQHLRLPAEWRRGYAWYDGDPTFASTFAAHWLEVPMQIGAFKRNGGEVPEEVGLLLSAYLQTGEVVNVRNFRNIANCTQLKFLPLVIGPTGLRYFMYRPSVETMQQGIVRFQEVLRRLGGLKDPRVLDGILKEMWARVQVKQVRNLLGDDHASTARLQATEAGLQFSISSTLAGYGLERGGLGFVYQDLKPGLHDVRYFHYDMLLQREK